MIYERRQKRSISWKVLLVVMGIALFLSCFMAWHDEHQNSGALIQEKLNTTIQKNSLEMKLDAKQDEIDILRNQLANAGPPGGASNALIQQQLDLEYEVSVDVIYQSHQIQIYNRGRTNIFLCGTQLDDTPRQMDRPRLISPSGGGPFGLGQGYYYLNGDQLERAFLGRIGQNGAASIPLKLFIEDGRRIKHTVDCILMARVSNGSITIGPQNVGITDGW